MENKKTVVYVILDAFRWDYIDEKNTPFLFELTKKSVYAKKLKSSTGFTQRTAMFTGIAPSESDVFTVFYRDPDNSPFKFLHKKSAKLVKLVEKMTRLPHHFFCKLNKLVRDSLIQSNGFRRCRFPIVANIPLNILPQLSLSEDQERGLWYPGSLGKIETLFDVLYKEDKNVSYLMYPIEFCGTTEKVMEGARRYVDDQDDLYLFQFNDSDDLVHFCGVNTQRRRDICRDVDSGLKQLVDLFESKFDDVSLVIIGDHGMSDVHKSLDVERDIKSIAKKNKLCLGKDFLYFLDSTMLRIWWLNNKAKEAFTSLYNKPLYKENGEWVNDELAEKYSIPGPGAKYGDMIWWVNQGVMIEPCFFHPTKNPVKAMHGYKSDYEDMKGFALCRVEGVSPKQIEECTLYDICPTICDAVGVRYPNMNKAKSLLK